MKKILASLLAVCMLFALCACGSTVDLSGIEASLSDIESQVSALAGGEAAAPAEEAAEEPAEEAAPAGETAGTVVIGVYEPQSGDNGAGGKQEILGMQYANAVAPTVEIGGEVYEVELVVADNESSNDKAVSAATKLISAGASIVLGSYGSGVSMAAADTFAEAGIPAVGVSCTNALVTDNDIYFRICFIDPDQGTIDANLLASMGYTNVYCLAMLGEDYGQGLVNYFVKAADELGITVTTDSFPEGNSDFTSYLTNAKNAGAEAIFAPCSTGYAQQIIAQAASMGYDVPLVAGDTWDSGVISEAAVEAGGANPIYCSTFYADGADPEFEAGIKEWINSDPTNLSNNGDTDELSAVTVLGYDAYFVALEALKAAGSTDPQAVLEALPGVSYTGITGEIYFKESGDADRHDAFIKTFDLESGSLVYYDLFSF